MDLKELNKTQLVLLTLLITFVVSIATAIVTVSLMKQMPKDIPQTINNIIERTIEKVTTVQAPVPMVNKNDSTKNTDENKKTDPFLGNGDALVSIYQINQKEIPISLEVDNLNTTNLEEQNQVTDTNTTEDQSKTLGQGIIISDSGLILVDSNILNDSNLYNIDLNKKMFEASILKKFNNGFTILKISPIVEKSIIKTTSQ